MPSIHRLFGLPRHTDSDEKFGPKSPKSPKSPRTPKSPKSPSFCDTHVNAEYLNQCEGCNNVDILIERNLEHQKNGMGSAPISSVILHNNFKELNQCAQKCQICRVFRQSLVLAEVTFDGVEKIQHAPGQVMVRCHNTTAASGARRVFLNVDIKGETRHAGVINCNSHNTVEHLALQSDGLGPAVIEQAKGWLATCLNDHVGECDNLRWSSENPRFLVEILSPTSVRLCENQKGYYVALSYCWGDTDSLPQPEQNEVERGKTYLANLDHRRKEFPMSYLPTTVRDALRIISAMGIRYAWIDTVCITQDKKDDMATMHKVYSNALFTLCSCATTKATAKLLDQRRAWTPRTEPCQLGGQWLTTADMSLNELRLRSPLAERAWTLQEERLSPRMLYVSNNRMYWSCAKGQEMELKPTYDQKTNALQRPKYAASDRNSQMPPAQDFLIVCRSGRNDLHEYWTDMVTSYALRDMGRDTDRLKALSGLAAKYLSANIFDEYLAGLWAKDLAEGLAWRVKQPIRVKSDKLVYTKDSPVWPSWSWAALPLQTAIDMVGKSKKSPHFEFVGGEGLNTVGAGGVTENAIERGENVKKICVTGRMRTLWRSSSRREDWSIISKQVNGEERFSFAANPEHIMHALHIESGRILVYEDRKREVIGQIDSWRDVQRLHLDHLRLWAFELGASTMLLLEHCAGDMWRRVGVAWDVRTDFFASMQCNTLILQ